MRGSTNQVERLAEQTIREMVSYRGNDSAKTVVRKRWRQFERLQGRGQIRRHRESNTEKGGLDYEIVVTFRSGNKTLAFNM